MPFLYFKIQITHICCLKLFSSSFVGVVKNRHFRWKLSVIIFIFYLTQPKSASSLLFSHSLLLIFTLTEILTLLICFFLPVCFPSWMTNIRIDALSTGLFMSFSIGIEWIFNPSLLSTVNHWFLWTIISPKHPFPFQTLSLAHCYLKTRSWENVLLSNNSVFLSPSVNCLTLVF